MDKKELEKLLQSAKAESYLSISYGHEEVRLSESSYGCGCCSYGDTVDLGKEIEAIDSQIEILKLAIDDLEKVKAYFSAKEQADG